MRNLVLQLYLLLENLAGRVELLGMILDRLRKSHELLLLRLLLLLVKVQKLRLVSVEVVWLKYHVRKISLWRTQRLIDKTSIFGCLTLSVFKRNSDGSFVEISLLIRLNRCLDHNALVLSPSYKLDKVS